MRILLIEDSKRLQQSISRGLRHSGFAVDVAGDGKRGLICAQTSAYDVIILDLMLPLMDGLTVLGHLRDKNVDSHVLILTARDAIEDRVRGLQAGADDYLVKPFAFDELLARIQSLIRRRHAIKTPTLVIGDLVVDLVNHRVLHKGEAIDLTAREFALLEYLACRRGFAVSRLELEEHIYDDRKRVMSNAVDSAICTLRAKLDLAGCQPVIRTRRGLGYLIDQSDESAGHIA